MRTLRLWLNLAFWFLPLAVLGGGAYSYVRSLWRYMNGGVVFARAVSAQATRTLGRTVTIREITLGGRPWHLEEISQINLSGLTIEDEGGGTSRFVTTERVVLRYNPLALLFPSRPDVPFFTEARLTEPGLTLRRNEQGQWNFDRIFNPEGTLQRPFAEKITFDNAFLNLDDRDFPRPPGVPRKSLRTRLERATGYLIQRADKSMVFDLSGMGAGDLTREFRLNGLIWQNPTRIDVRFNARNADLAFLGERLIAPKYTRLTAGHADIDLRLHSSEPKQFIWRGDFAVNGLATTSSPLLGGPFSGVNGVLTLSNDAVIGDLNGAYDAMPLHLRGSMMGLGLSSNAPSPTLSVQGEMPTLDVRRLLMALSQQEMIRKKADLPRLAREMEGVGDVRTYLTGPLNNPAFVVTARMANLRYNEAQAKNLEIRAVYADKEAQIEARGGALGGEAALRGTVRTDGSTPYRLEAHGRGIKLTQIARFIKQPVQGIADVDLVTVGDRKQIETGRAQVKIARLQRGETLIKSLYAQVDVRQNQVNLRTVRVEDDRGTAVVSGTVNLNTHALSLKLDADELDLNALLKTVQQESGTFGLKHIPLPESAFSVSLGQTSLQEGEFPNTFLLQQRRRRTKKEPPGVEGFAGPWLVPPVGREMVLGLPEPFAASPNAFSLDSVEGVGYLRSRIVGKWDKPSLQGRVSLFGVEVGRIGVDRAVVDVQLSRQQLTITNGNIQHDLGNIKFSGSLRDPLGIRPQINARAQASKFEIAEILDFAGLDSGDLALTGGLNTDEITVEGTLAHPRIPHPFTVVLNNATLNGQGIQDVLAKATVDENGLNIVEAKAHIGSGRLSLAGQVGWDGLVNLTAIGQSLNLDMLEAISPVEFPVRLEGDIGFEANVRGTAEYPLASVQVTTEALTLEGYPLGSLQGTVNYANRRVDVKEVALTKPDAGNVTLHNFTYDVDSKKIQGEAEWQGLPLAGLRDLTQTFVETRPDEMGRPSGALTAFAGPMEGHLSGKASVTGTLENPQAAINWNASGIRLQGYAVDDFAGQAIVDKRHIRVPSATIEARNASLVIEAKDIDAVYEGELKGDISAYNVDLALLQKWFTRTPATPIVGQSLRQLRGIADNISIVAGGQTKSPELQLSVSLRDVASVDPTQITYDDQKLDRVELYDATVKEGAITGNLRISKKDRRSANPVDLDLRANGSVKFSWQPPFIPADAELDLQTGTPERPQLDLPVSGLFELAKVVSLNLSSRPGQKGAPGAPAPLDPLRTSDGRFLLAARVGGTLDNPTVSGSMQIRASRIRFLDFATGLTDVDGVLLLDNDTLKIAPGFRANTQVFVRDVPDATRPGRAVQLSGSIPLGLGEDASTLVTDGVRLAAKGVTFEESPLPGIGSGYVRGTGDLDLSVKGTVLKPQVSGYLALYDARAGLPRGLDTPSTERAPLPIDPQLDIQVRLLQNVRLSNAQLNARIEGNVEIAGSVSEPKASGTLSVRDGSISLPTARFTVIAPGSIQLLYPTYEGFSTTPTLALNVDMRAQSFLSARSYYGQTRNYRVIATIHGPLTDALDPVTGQPKLQLNFQTDPPDLAVSQASINQRLTGLLSGTDPLGTGNTTTGQLTQQVTNIFTGSVLSGILNKPASQLGFEQLSLSYDANQQLSLSVSRRLFGDFYIAYFRSLSGVQNSDSYKASWRFSERFQLSYDVDIYRNQQFLLEGILKF